MYITTNNINNLLSTELLDRNLFLKNTNYKLVNIKSLKSVSQNEFSLSIKFILFLILLFTNKTFNKLYFGQMILSSFSSSGLKRKELVHKSLLTINHFYKFINSSTSISFLNQFMLLTLFMYSQKRLRIGQFWVKFFKKGELLIRFENFKIQNNLSESKDSCSNKVSLYFKSAAYGYSKYYSYTFQNFITDSEKSL